MNCPKHVDFYSKNKFEKLVHLVGFIIRIYHGHCHLNVKNSNSCAGTNAANIIHVSLNMAY